MMTDHNATVPEGCLVHDHQTDEGARFAVWPNPTGVQRLVMPEECQENDDRNWNTEKPEQHTSTESHANLHHLIAQ